MPERGARHLVRDTSSGHLVRDTSHRDLALMGRECGRGQALLPGPRWPRFEARQVVAPAGCSGGVPDTSLTGYVAHGARLGGRSPGGDAGARCQTPCSGASRALGCRRARPGSPWICAGQDRGQNHFNESRARNRPDRVAGSAPGATPQERRARSRPDLGAPLRSRAAEASRDRVDARPRPGPCLLDADRPPLPVLPANVPARSRRGIPQVWPDSADSAPRPSAWDRDDASGRPP